MMLLRLLEQNELDPKRGDVIVFNNTSAEHPETYAFVRRMKDIAERKYNIPFFWIEYQTYEDAVRGEYKRCSSYRLVNSRSYSDHNPNGYHCRGEVFEEMVSHDGFVPNIQNRSCTLRLKIIPTNQFLTDWFAQKSGIDHQGHYGDAAKITNKMVIKAHKDNRGEVPDEILLNKKQYVRSRPFVRPAARWQDFTKSKLCMDNVTLKDSVLGGRSQLFGDFAISYRSYLGIRKDEEIRIDKINARIAAANNGQAKFHPHQPPKEIVCAPLVEQGVTQKEVTEYWASKEFNLKLPDTGLFSNCVYCPLKGKRKLLQIAKMKRYNGKSIDGTPAAIDWWANLEERYGRDLHAEKRDIANESTNFIGFFGATDKWVYKQIQQHSDSAHASNMKSVVAEYLEDEDYTPCNCTD